MLLGAGATREFLLKDAHFAATDVNCPAGSVQVLNHGKTIRSVPGNSAWVGARGLPGYAPRENQVAVTFHVRILSGLCRVGWGVFGGGLILGTDAHSWGYGGAAKISHEKHYQDWGEAFQAGDVISATLDLKNMNISFAKNGRSLGVAFSGLGVDLRKKQWHPCFAMKEGSLELTSAPSNSADPPSLLLFRLPKDVLHMIVSYMPLSGLRVQQDFHGCSTMRADRGWCNMYRSLSVTLLNPYILPLPRGFLYTKVQICSGFVGGVLVNGMPLGANYQDCGGSIARFFTGHKNRDQLLPYINELSEKMNKGLINLVDIEDELKVFLEQLQAGLYTVSREIVAEDKVPGAGVDHLTYPSTKVGVPNWGYWDAGGFLQETQPSEKLNQERVKHYEKVIQKAYAALPSPSAPAPKVEASATTAKRAKPPPAANEAPAAKQYVKYPFPLLLIARTGEVDFILDGHHKYRAYMNCKLSPVSIVIEPHFMATHELMEQLIPGDQTGLALLKRFG